MCVCAREKERQRKRRITNHCCEHTDINSHTLPSLYNTLSSLDIDPNIRMEITAMTYLMPLKNNLFVFLETGLYSCIGSF